ncbi:comG operon protein ComGC [Crossiella cryophila]|uniref:ComG operon protein 3 n=1 Tax=Salisediminibacterium halotolerans TaxID=517425 RepID=A0A1H9SDT5_9BACI|nr:competence type IV pilus major pilin ComGC [Salisediminibacterium haloalkalitolerans]SER82349.1 competence protein ComGC [Salisediminibacterium haloalkalitolerans]
MKMTKMKNEKGFTLIEMMVVLLIISILLLVMVPAMAKNQEVAGSKGCEATIELLNAQVMAFEADRGERPSSLEELKTEGYVDRITCPDGDTELTLTSSGVVKVED